MAQSTTVVDTSRRAPRLAIAVCLGCLLGLAAIIAVPPWAPKLLKIEHQFADWRTVLLSDRRGALHPDIAVVLITEDTLESYAYSSPVDRGLLADLVGAIAAAGARAVGLDIFFVKATEEKKDDALIAALREAPKQGCSVVLGALDERGRLKPNQREYQSRFIALAGQPAGYLNLSRDPDEVVRYRALPAPRSAYPESFAALLADIGGRGARASGDRIAWLLPPRGQPSPFLTLSAEAVLPNTKQNADAVAHGLLDQLKDKVVLIGGDFPYRDQHLTPLAAFGGEEIAGVLIHAHMVAQLIDGRSFFELTAPQARGLLAGLASAGFILGWFFGSLHRYLLGWTAATAALIAADAIAFAEFRIILPFTLALLAWLFSATCGRNMHTVVTWLRSEGRMRT